MATQSILPVQWNYLKSLIYLVMFTHLFFTTSCTKYNDSNQYMDLKNDQKENDQKYGKVFHMKKEEIPRIFTKKI